MSFTDFEIIYILYSPCQSKIGEKTKEAIKKRFGTHYVVGNIAETICKN